MMDYSQNVQDIRERVQRESDALRRAGHTSLTDKQMPAKKLLRQLGYPNKLSPFHRGKNTDVQQAEMYVIAAKNGWPVNFNRIMLNKLSTDGHTELMQRFNMSSTLMPLFKNTSTTDQYHTFTRLLRALRATGLNDFTNPVGLQSTAESTLTHLLQRNRLHSFGELTQRNANLFMAFHNVHMSTIKSTDTTVSSTIKRWLPFNLASRMGLLYGINRAATAGPNPHRAALPWRLYSAFNMDEIDMLLQHAYPVNKIYVGVDIREKVDPQLPLSNLIEYLDMPDSILHAYFPQISNLK